MTSSTLALLVPPALLASAVMLSLWVRQARTRDATIVDVGWAALLVTHALWYALAADGLAARRVIVAALVTLASGRLAWHLLADRARTGIEDPRYRTLREAWGARANRNFFWFFQAQAGSTVLLSLPFLLASASTAELGPLDFTAIALGLAAWIGESQADRELKRFRSDPRHRGRTCRVGLWKYSRHPNYFFQWVAWCAYALLAWSAPLGWIGLVSPLAMLVLILRVTGIPPTEAQAVRSRGDDYREYQRTTSAFVPWFPRGSSS